MTGGSCEQLDIDSVTGSDRLTDLVSTKILSQWGNDYVVTYKKKFGYCEK